MNLQEMSTELEGLRAQWERDSHAPDHLDNGTWMRTVAYGIKLATQLVQRRAAASESMRGRSERPDSGTEA